MKYLSTMAFISLVFAATALPQSAGPVASLPTAEEVLEKYLRAIGGRAAHEKLTTRISRGQWENVTRGVRQAIEIYAKAPNKRVELLDAPENPGITGRGYDGAKGWSMNMLETGLREVKGAELSMMERESDFYRQIELGRLYERLAVVRKESINGREVFCIEAVPGIGAPEKLYFDVATGLLTARDVVYESIHGKTPVRHYYEDYREIDGIKLPYVLRSEGPVMIQTKLTEVKHNVPIEDAKFKSPASR